MTDMSDLFGEGIEPEARQIRPALSSVVLGIVALVLSFIPGGNIVAVIPAVLAVVMGIGGLRDGVAGRRLCFAGIALGPVAIAIAALTLSGLFAI